MKTTNGSHSGPDTSIQAKKQAQKSHALVPLKTLPEQKFQLKAVKFDENLCKIHIEIEKKTGWVL
jgi:hypothetical protein